MYLVIDPPNPPQSQARVEWDGTNPQKSGGSKRGKDGTAPRVRVSPIFHLRKAANLPLPSAQSALWTPLFARLVIPPWAFYCTVNTLITLDTHHQHHHAGTFCSITTSGQNQRPLHPRQPTLPTTPRPQPNIFVEPAREQTTIAHPSSFLDEQASKSPNISEASPPTCSPCGRRHGFNLAAPRDVLALPSRR